MKLETVKRIMSADFKVETGKPGAERRLAWRMTAHDIWSRSAWNDLSLTKALFRGNLPIATSNIKAARLVARNREIYAEEIAELRQQIRALDNKPFETSIRDQQLSLYDQISEVMHRE